MRIFVSMPDQTGTNKTTRLSVLNCQDTTQLIKIICKQIHIDKNSFVFLLKNEIVNLRILEDWPLQIYGIKNGSWIILKQNQLFIKKYLSNSTTTSLENSQEQILQDISEEIQNSVDSSSNKQPSLNNNKSEQNYSQYFQKQLQKMLKNARDSNLFQLAQLLKQEPLSIDNQQKRNEIMDKKNTYILNQIGQCGRNSLHWAIHNQNLEIVSFLLIKKVDPNTLTIDQYTPLQLAVVHNNLDIPTIDVNKLTSHGTALHLAAYHHSILLIKQLLQNGAKPQIIDKDGKRPIQLSQIRQIKNQFYDHQKRINLRLLKPNITKGNIFKISSMTFRSKVCTLILNPFKNQLTISKQSNFIQNKIKISTIKNVQKVSQKSWLMDSKLNYFKIQYALQTSSENKSKIVLATKHLPILDKWLNSLQIAQTYVNNQKYVSRIQPQLQLIEVVDDTKNQIKVHKRIVQKKKVESPAKHKYSIINMKIQNQEQEKVRQTKQIEIKQKQREKRANMRSVYTIDQQYNLRESQILLGSILMQKNFDSSQIYNQPIPNKLDQKYQYNRHTVSSTVMNGRDNFELTQQIDFLTQPAKQLNFRKKSFDSTIVSEFKIEEKTLIKQKSKQEKVAKKVLSFTDFQFQKLLGSGAFGQVYLCKHLLSANLFAMKVLNKKRLMAKKHLKYAVSQTNILKRIQHPFIITLHHSFQTPSNLYLALDYCPFGDLSEVLCEKQRFSQSTARFLIAQIILAIEYLHREKIIYRDLKPQNILIARDGYAKLIDFGLSKQNHWATSFCGSPAYLSPQMLQKKGHTFAIDIYGLGCVLYEMIVGQPPFFDQNMEQMFQNIKNARLKYPGYITKEAKSLLGKMLQRDMSKRIGNTNMKQLKQHDFFKGLSWQKLIQKQLQVPKEIFPQSLQSQYFKLQKNIDNQSLKYTDRDYTQNQMLNRIKGFSFSRENKTQKN